MEVEEDNFFANVIGVYRKEVGVGLKYCNGNTHDYVFIVDVSEGAVLHRRIKWAGLNPVSWAKNTRGLDILKSLDLTVRANYRRLPKIGWVCPNTAEFIKRQLDKFDR